MSQPQQNQATSSITNVCSATSLSENNKKRSYDEEDEEDTSITIEEGAKEKKERKGRKAPHELLTEAEKKANHIASEKKRRQNIRLGFDQLIESVPSLTQGNRSEAFILQKSVDHIKHLMNVKNDLKTQIRDLQAILGES
ncbi:MAG: hypothetical protein EXX96DRAFT_622827 [Benjaminiella poitrasii]|nr:MAG: hypothetical protein EXX96DRAFT_622827 [Benjaminiella poitrasii]